MTETGISYGKSPSTRPPWIVAGQVTGGHVHIGVWPEVPADSWCGDFAFKQEV